ncbi:MAG: hypothetical protein H7Z40_22785 [Phycisphaerae bacterium]|nr:hypothetical protein [Gemmatimonadaceae bacterium]
MVAGPSKCFAAMITVPPGRTANISYALFPGLPTGLYRARVVVLQGVQSSATPQNEYSAPFSVRQPSTVKPDG